MHGFKSFKINHPIVMTRDKKLRIKYPIVYRTRDILFRTRDPMVWKQGYKSLELGIQKFKPGIEKFRTSSNPMKSKRFSSLPRKLDQCPKSGKVPLSITGQTPKVPTVLTSSGGLRINPAKHNNACNISPWYGAETSNLARVADLVFSEKKLN